MGQESDMWPVSPCEERETRGVLRLERAGETLMGAGDTLSGSSSPGSRQGDPGSS